MLYHIYRILVGDKVYIGCTNDLKRRFKEHRTDWHSSHFPLYVAMIGAWKQFELSMWPMREKQTNKNKWKSKNMMKTHC